MSKRTPPLVSTRRRRMLGFTLVELMIAMVLGLIVIAGAGSVFVASSRTYQTNTALSEVQTNARVAFGMLARSIRNAGQTPCTNNGRVANVVNGANTYWWLDWSNAIHGYGTAQTDPATPFGTAVGDRVTGTASVQILSAGTLPYSIQTDGEGGGTAASFKLYTSKPSLADGDIVMVCDPNHATIVQIQNKNGGVSATWTHSSGNNQTPGNCSKGLGYPTVCGGNANGNIYTFPPNSSLVKMLAEDWYIGHNAAGTTSLYRAVIQNIGGVPSVVRQEMVRNVSNMQLLYHQLNNADFAKAPLVTNWAAVDAVHMDLTILSSDTRAGTNFTALKRQFSATTTIRNRVK